MFFNSNFLNEFENTTSGFSRFFDEPQLGRYGYPAVNVYLNEDRVKIYAELPGLKKEDLEITITDDVLNLKGELNSDLGENEKTVRNERIFGTFSRSIELPRPVDANDVEAKLTNGILEVILNVKEEVKPKQITIKAQ